jgi:hypothetical protein
VASTNENALFDWKIVEHNIWYNSNFHGIRLISLFCSNLREIHAMDLIRLLYAINPSCLRHHACLHLITVFDTHAQPAFFCISRGQLAGRVCRSA